MWTFQDCHLQNKMSHTSTFDSWTDQVRWFVDQVAARCIKPLHFNTLSVESTSTTMAETLGCFAIGQAQDRTQWTSERFLRGFPSSLSFCWPLKMSGSLESGGLLFPSLRTVGDDQFRDIRNIKLSQSWTQEMWLKNLRPCTLLGARHLTWKSNWFLPLSILPLQACLLFWSWNANATQNE